MGRAPHNMESLICFSVPNPRSLLFGWSDCKFLASATDHLMHPNLEVNDCIIAIGGESVAGFHFDKIMSILTASPRPVKLTFMRPPKVEEYVYTFEAGPIGLVLGDSVNDSSGQRRIFYGYKTIATTNKHENGKRE